MKIYLVKFSQSRMDVPAGENDPKDRTGDKVHPTRRWELPMLTSWFTLLLMRERTKPWLSAKA